MDLFKIFSDLVKESVQFKGFNKLCPALRVLCFIVLIPFVVLYTVLLIAYLVIATIYKVLHSIFDYLYIFVHQEGKIVKHATQAVIYFVAFPFLFALKVLYGILAFPLFILHFITSHVGYIATFGGIRYSPFMYEPVNRSENKGPAKQCVAAVIVFVVIGMILLIGAIGFKPITTDIYKDYKTDTVCTELLTRMREGVDSKNNSVSEWNEFVKSYNAQAINGDNYLEYAVKYRLYSQTPVWDTEKEAEFLLIVDLVDALLALSYTLFTILYVSIYSNAIKRRRPETTDSIEEATPIEELAIETEE